jgi:hypothetical protein
MDTMQRIKGMNLSPLAVSYSQRFGETPDVDNLYGFDNSRVGEILQEAANKKAAEEAAAKKAKGEWWEQNSGAVINALPDIICTLFPKQCANRNVNSLPSPTNYPQAEPKRDWLTVSLIVVVIVVLLILILKK